MNGSAALQQPSHKGAGDRQGGRPAPVQQTWSVNGTSLRARARGDEARGGPVGPAGGGARARCMRADCMCISLTLVVACAGRPVQPGAARRCSSRCGPPRGAGQAAGRCTLALPTAKPGVEPLLARCTGACIQNGALGLQFAVQCFSGPIQLALGKILPPSRSRESLPICRY